RGASLAALGADVVQQQHRRGTGESVADEAMRGAVDNGVSLDRLPEHRPQPIGDLPVVKARAHGVSASPTSPRPERRTASARPRPRLPKPVFREGRVVAAERTIPRLIADWANVALHWRYESRWLRRPTVRSRTDRMGCSRPAWSTGGIAPSSRWSS